MTEIRFLFDGTDYGPPLDFGGISLQYGLREDIYLVSDIPLQLSFCSVDLLAYVEAQQAADICGEIEVDFEFRCCPTDNWEALRSYILRVRDVTTDCINSIVSFTLENDNPVSSIRKEASTEACFTCANFETQQLGNDEVCITQFQSGGVIRENGDPVTACFRPISTLFEDFSNTFYSQNAPFNLTGTIFSQSYVNQITEVTIPAFAASDTLELNIVTELGSEYNITVIPNGGDTTTTVAEKFRNALLYAVQQSGGFFVTMDEVIHRLTGATANLGVLTIESDYPLRSITYTQNLVANPGAVVVTQPYVFGLQDLAISGRNLRPNNFCLSFQEIIDFLCSIYPIIIREQGDTLDISGFDDVFDLNQIPSISVADRFTNCNFQTDVMKPNLELGYVPAPENVQESNLSWNWEGTPVSLCPFPVNLPPVAIGAGGTLTLNGTFDLTNNAVSVRNVQDIQILLAGVNIVDTYVPLTWAAGQSRTVNFSTSSIDGGFFLLDIPVCVSLGDLIEMRLFDGTGTDITADFSGSNCSVTYATDFIDFNFPLIREDTDYNRSGPYVNLTDFANCTGTKEKTIPDQFYAGMGYQTSQIAQGLQDYDQFIVSFIETRFGDPECPRGTKNFGRSFYFDTTAPFPCFQDEVITYFYHNLPLQLPFLRFYHAQRCPSEQSFRAFQFNRIVDFSGNIIVNDDDEFLGTIPRQNNLIKNCSFQDCLSINDFLTIVQEAVISVDLCNQGAETTIVTDLTATIIPSFQTVTVRSEF